MITLTGFDFVSFEYLCNLFAPYYNDFSPWTDPEGYIVRKKTKRGRPRLLSAEDCLGLVLAWTRTRGSLMALQLIFGMTMTPVGKYIQFARRILVRVLKTNDMAKITMPTVEKLEEYRTMIAERHPALPDVWGTMDGLKVTIEAAGIILRSQDSTTVGSVTISSPLFCVLLLMVPFLLLRSIFLAALMIVQLLTGGDCTQNWRMFIKLMA